MVYLFNFNVMVHVFKTLPIKDLKQNVSLNVRVTKDKVFAVASPLLAFQFTLCKGCGDKPVYALSRDIAILLDQKKLTDRSLNGIVDFIASNVRTSAVSDQFAGLSDDELVSVVKSRYVQHPSELLSWSEWLEENLTALSDAAKQVENSTEKVENRTDTTNTDVSSSD